MLQKVMNIEYTFTYYSQTI